MDRVPLAEEVPDLDDDLDEDPWSDDVEADLDFDESPIREYEPEFDMDEQPEDDDDEEDGSEA